MSKYYSNVVNNIKVLPDPQSIVFDYKVAGNDISTITSNYNGYEMVTNIVVNNFSLNLFRSNILNHGGFKIDGTQFSSYGDNMAPVTIRNINIGGAHGYSAQGFNIIGHNKTIVDDIYSVWQLDGGTEQIILYTINGDSLYFTSRTTGVFTLGIYNHISGATHTTSMDLSVRTATPNLYPNRKLVSKNIYIDGIEKSTSINGNWTATENVQIKEVYDIVDERSFKDYMVTLQGSGELIKNGGGDSILRVTNTFNIDETGFISGLISWDVLVNNLNFQYYIAMQQASIATFGDYWYVPKVKSVTTSDGTFNLTNITPYQDLTAELNYSSSYYEMPTSPPDRQLQIMPSKGGVYVQGFLPVKDAAIGIRVNMVNIAMSIRQNSEKHYMRGISSDKIGTTLSLGTKHELIGYRGVVPIENGRTVSYFVKDYETGISYFYGDWHDLPTDDSINIPLGLRGKTITVLEKTTNVSITDTILGATLNVEITNTHNYGFLTLKLN